MALYIPIPRVLWPDKPSISDTGVDFNYLLNLDIYTSSSPGIFAEAYWNGGWFYVALICLAVGFLFAGFTRYSVQKCIH